MNPNPHPQSQPLISPYQPTSQLCLDPREAEQNLRAAFNEYKKYYNQFINYYTNITRYMSYMSGAMAQGQQQWRQWRWNPGEEQRKLFQEWKDYTIGYLIACPDGINILRLLSTLSDQVGEDVPLNKMGLPSVYHFLYEMCDVVEIRRTFVQTRMGFSRSDLHVLINESAIPEHSKHVRKMVLEQRKPKDEFGRKIKPLRGQSEYVPPSQLLIEYYSRNRARFTQPLNQQSVGPAGVGYFVGYQNQPQGFINHNISPSAYYQTSAWMSAPAQRPANSLPFQQPHPYQQQAANLIPTSVLRTQPLMSINFNAQLCPTPQNSVSHTPQLSEVKPQFPLSISGQPFSRQDSSKPTNHSNLSGCENEKTFKDKGMTEKPESKVSNNVVPSAAAKSAQHANVSTIKTSPKVPNDSKLGTASAGFPEKPERVQISESEGNTKLTKICPRQDSSIEDGKPCHTPPRTENIKCKTDEPKFELKILKCGIGRGILKNRSSFIHSETTQVQNSSRLRSLEGQSPLKDFASQCLRGIGRGRILRRCLPQELLPTKDESTVPTQDAKSHQDREKLVVDFNVNRRYSVDTPYLYLGKGSLTPESEFNA